jgi:hypothetical protein
MIMYFSTAEFSSVGYMSVPDRFRQPVINGTAEAHKRASNQTQCLSCVSTLFMTNPARESNEQNAFLSFILLLNLYPWSAEDLCLAQKYTKVPATHRRP